MREDRVSELTKKKGIHPRIEELLEHLAEHRAVLKDAVAHVAPFHGVPRSADGRWSVGEVLDHVHRVESGFARLVTKRAGEARAKGGMDETETASIMGSVDSRMLTDRSRRIQAPEMVVPREGATVADGLAALDASRAAVHRALIEANGIALGAIMHTHPVFGEMNLYQWGLVLGYHDARHAEQIREIGRAPNGR
jgi:hypothetical protein